MAQVLDAHVAAGKMVGFITKSEEGSTCHRVSQRAAVWLLQILEGKLDNCAQYAITEGRAVQIEYWYGSHRAVLGVYASFELRDFWRGLRSYYKRKMKNAQRKVLAKQRELAAAQKGGLTL